MRIILGLLLALLAVPAGAEEAAQPQCVPPRGQPSAYLQLFPADQPAAGTEVTAFVDDYARISVNVPQPALRQKLLAGIEAGNAWVVVERAPPGKTYAGTFRFYDSRPGRCAWLSEPYAISQEQVDEPDPGKQLPLAFLIVLKYTQ